MPDNVSTILLSLISAVIGGLVAHWLALLRQKTMRRDEIRIEFLINAYRQLERNSNRGDQYNASQLETAIADIQLLGTKTQSELAQQFAVDFAAKGTASLDELLADLCDTLRNELNLKSVPKNVRFLRIDPN